MIMETKFNFNSQICTTREQSERLVALGLKEETADCCWTTDERDNIIICLIDDAVEYIEHAWSLHRLLLIIPKEVNIDGYIFPLRSDAVMRMNEADDMYEYVIGVLERTIKQGYFNKEYLKE